MLKHYVVVTGLIFALITIAHLARFAYEPHLMRDPIYLALTCLAAGLAGWAWQLWRR